MKYPHQPLRLPLLFLVSCFLFSCHASRNAAENENTVTLSSLAKKSAQYEGKEIHLEGFYLGWNHNDCRFPASFSSLQITRSDWTFRDGKRCCFVTGGIPAGLNTLPDHPIPVKLTAKVRNKDSKIYLEYVSSQLTK